MLSLTFSTALAENSPYQLHRWNNRWSIASLAVAPDGQAVVASHLAVVTGWDVANQPTWEQEIGDEFSSTTAMAMRADGALVAAATDDCELHVWVRSDPRLHVVYTDLDECPLSLAFSPDGHRLAAGCEDGAIRLCDASNWLVDGRLSMGTARPTRSIDLRSGEIKAIAFSPDGKHLVATTKGTTKVIEVASGKVVAELVSTGPALDFSRDGRRLFAGNSVIDTSNWRPIFHLDYPFTITSAVFSPNVVWLATTGNDNRVVFWHAQTGQRLAAIRAHDDVATAVAMNSAGSAVFTGSEDGTLASWDAQRILQERPLEEPFDKLAKAAAAFDCWRLAADWTTGVLQVSDKNRHPGALKLAAERASRLKITLPELPADSKGPNVGLVFSEGPKLAAQLKERYGETAAELFATCMLLRVFQDYYDPTNPKMAGFKEHALPGLREALVDKFGGAPQMLDPLVAALDAGGTLAGAKVRITFKQLIREVDVYLEAQDQSKSAAK
ncbi:MAG: hypothetical protein K2Y37_16800 [Pirellulales bacterium]|nr:hypothetical protein [Pirellulales bacterium]